MGIFKKMEDVFRANLNDLLDKATDPMKMLNLMIEDLKDFRQQRVVSIGEVVTAMKVVEADLNDAKASVASWTKRAEKAANDADVKIALKHQIQQEGLVKILETALKENQEMIAKLKEDLKQLDEKADWLESQRSIVEVRVKTAKARKGMHGPISKHGDAPNVDGILDRVGEKVKKLEAEADAAEEIEDLQKPERAEDRFKEEELDDEVEQRLADLKAKKAENK